MHIHEAQQGDAPVEPHCCGTPLPREVVEEVLAKEEVELIANRQLFEAQVEAARGLSCNEKVPSVIDAPARNYDPARNFYESSTGHKQAET
jgi:hypothetical protein